MKYLGPILLLSFIVLKFLLQYFLVHPVYELHRDEFLHLEQANHLAAGYVSLPPFTSWIALIIKLLGNSEFWVKFFPALFGALTLWVSWKITEEVGGNLYAKVLTATALLFSALVRINMLFQPNSFEVFCWTLIFYFLVLYTKYQKPEYLIWTGIAVGFGFLIKYNILFLVVSLLAALLLTPLPGKDSIPCFFDRFLNFPS